MRSCFVLALCGCGGKEDSGGPTPTPPVTSSGCVTDDECPTDQICDESGACVGGDRDDGPDSARPVGITLNPEASGVIEPPGDIDWWVYSATAPVWLDVRTIDDGDLDTVLRVWTAAGDEYAAIDNFATGYASGYDSVLRVYLPEAGDWFFTVEDVTTYYTDLFGESDWRGGADFTYDFWVASFESDLDEPDALDDPSETIDIDDGSTIFSYGFIVDQAGDTDYAGITLNVGGQPLEVWTQPHDYGSSLDLRARLYDATGGVLSDRPNMGADAYLSYFNPGVGDYMVELTDSAGVGGPDAWGVIYVRTYESDSLHPFFSDSVYVQEFEPNDDQATATGVATFAEGDKDFAYDAGHFQGTLELSLDVDRYDFAAAAGELVSLRCFTESFGSLASLSVRVFDGNDVDATPVGQGDTIDGDEYYLVNVPVNVTADWSVSIGSLDGNYGLDAYYRCAVFLTTENVDPG